MKEANLLRGKLCLFSKEKSFNDFARNCKSLEKIINEIKNRSHYKLQGELLGRKDVLKLLVLQKKNNYFGKYGFFLFYSSLGSQTSTDNCTSKKSIGQAIFFRDGMFFLSITYVNYKPLFWEDNKLIIATIMMYTPARRILNGVETCQINKTPGLEEN